jgi:LytS/YehU family sensor histidine kinase
LAILSGMFEYSFGYGPALLCMPSRTANGCVESGLVGEFPARRRSPVLAG